MIKRYANPKITWIFSDLHKLKLWQEMELAVIQAKENLKLIPKGTHKKIADIWLKTRIDLKWWRKKDEEIHHDLNAFVLERTRHLPVELQEYVHQGITSYDTEETPMLQMLHEASDIVIKNYYSLEVTLIDFALKNRYLPTIARTHGQEAELKTLGARALGWRVDLDKSFNDFMDAFDKTFFSKASGAVGVFGGISPEVEKEALEILEFKPYYGATQILPRIIHAPLAQSLSNLVAVIDKIANDIRLNARSGRPLLQEPFKKKQTGSSAMPHKKNPIQLEQIEGLARLAKANMLALTENIKTWEERTIEQSSVERVAWPDLFHLADRAITVLNKVLNKLTVYRDNMLQEIVESRGVYASGEAKEFIKSRLAPKGLEYEECYRIVQLACFNVFEPSKQRLSIRNRIPESYEQAEIALNELRTMPVKEIVSIEALIPAGQLHISESLDIHADEIGRYNRYLLDMFDDQATMKEWHELFTPTYLLRHEATLFRKILEE